jgi:hypothetical protein
MYDSDVRVNQNLPEYGKFVEIKEALFKFQLERNYFTSTPYELTLVAAANSSSGATGMYASMDWEEVSR